MKYHTVVTSVECSTLSTVAACEGNHCRLAIIHSVYETVNSCHSHLDQLSANAFHLQSGQ